MTTTPSPSPTSERTVRRRPRVGPEDGRVETATNAVRYLADEVGPRPGHTAAYVRAAAWVEEQLEGYGWEVARQRFPSPPGISWGIPVEGGPSVNLIATRGDLRPDEPWIAVGAHLDTVPQAPGAEDNASGVGALLAIAEATRDSRTRLPLVLIAFGSEEPRGEGDERNHYGSRAYVAELTPQQRRSLRGMVSLDRVGVGDVLPIGSASEPSRLRTELARAAERAGVEYVLETGQASSDHWSFVRDGLAGVRLGGTSYGGYHDESDTADVADPVQLGRTIRTVLAWLRGSSPAEPPSARDRPRPEPVSIAVAGDVHFEGVLRGRLDDPETALAPATGTLAAADVAIVNLETSVGTGGRPDRGKRYTFQAPPTAFTALAAAGIDVASMANNHALDFGRDPLPGMFDAIDDARTSDPPLAVVGIGRDTDDAFRPVELDVDGTIVATIGATVADEDPTADPTGQWAATDRSAGTADAIDPARLLRAVVSAGRSADVVVVYLHWGVQGERCPSSAQRSLAEDLVDSGADVVVGSHAHVLQGAGRLGRGYVAYGLGNYAWYSQASEATSTTGVLTMTVRPPRSPAGRASVTEAAWEPARIGADGLPTAVVGAAAGFRTDLDALRACAGLTR